MKKAIGIIIGIVAVILVMGGIFWFFFNMGDEDIEVRETKKIETQIREIETYNDITKTEDDVIVVDREELKRKQEEERKKVRLLEDTFMAICSKGQVGDWEGLPLSENFRAKYNEKDGIIDKSVDYDKPLYNNLDTDKKEVRVVLYKDYGKQNEKEYVSKIKYKLDKNGDIDEIVNVETEMTNGENSLREIPENENWALINEDSISSIIWTVSKPNAYWGELKLTDNFKSKYNKKNGILGIQDINKVSNVATQGQDYKNKTVNIEVIYNDRTTERYIVKWEANSSNELNDVKVSKVEQEDNSPAVKSGLIPAGTKVKSYDKPVLSNKGE